MISKLEVIYQFLEKKNIFFKDSLSKEMFESHIRALMSRSERNELLEVGTEDYSAILEEIDDEALEISTDIVKTVINQGNLMESILVATHLQNLINNGKE